MKKLIILILFISPFFVFSQKQIQIKNQKFEVFGVRNGQPVHKVTTNLHVSINYETGDIAMGIDMSNVRLISEEELPRKDKEGDICKFTGKLPINDILYNKQTDQNYKVELNIINKGVSLPVIFDFDVKYYSSSQRGFRQFFGSSTYNLNDFSDELFGYEPEVKVVISFQAYIVGG